MSGALVVAVVDSLPPADDRIYGPEAFGIGWLVAGMAALGVAVALAVWTLRRPGPPPTVRPAPAPALGVQARYLDELDELDRRAHAHELDARELHHALSATLRRFAAEVGPRGAPAMSAAALDAAGQSRVATALRSYEQPQFDEVPASDPAHAVEQARAVITSWRGP